MKMKKILAALAASTMAVAMLGLTVSAAGEEATDDTIGDVVDDVDVDDTDDVVDDADDVDVDDTDDVDVDDTDDTADVDVDDTDDTADVDVDDTADVPAENPGTGNSPIALAVIPVALAAAAVVAKKVK